MANPASEVGASFDVQGIAPVPTAYRDSTPMHQFWIWAGANLAPLNWVLGSLGIVLGLSLVTTIVVIAIGNLFGCLLFGTFAYMGSRTGVNQMVFARAAFGRRGAYFPVVLQGLTTMGWIGVNTWVVLDLVVGILHQAGYEAGTGVRYAVGMSLMAIQVLIAIVGFHAIRTFEKWTVPVAGLIMAAMSILAWSKTSVVWTHSTAHGADRLTAITQLLTAIGVGWGISWLTYSSDYSRFVRPGTRGWKVVLATGGAMYIPTVWLATLGASIASSGTGTDPSRLVTAAFGAMAIPVLFLIMHGPIAVNILNVYSNSLAALSIGIRWARWKVSLVTGLAGAAVLAAFIQATSFAQSFDNWIAALIVWMSPWAAITLIDYFVLRRQQLDVETLYAEPTGVFSEDVNVPAVIALVAGIVAGWAWEFGLVAPMQGPIARAAHGTDFSWLTGMLVAGGLYYGLSVWQRRTVAAPAPTLPAEVAVDVANAAPPSSQP